MEEALTTAHIANGCTQHPVRSFAGKSLQTCLNPLIRVLSVDLTGPQTNRAIRSMSQQGEPIVHSKPRDKRVYVNPHINQPQFIHRGCSTPKVMIPH